MEAFDMTTNYTPDVSFELGRLHGKLAALETRVTSHDALFANIDAKLDKIALDIATATGASDSMSKLASKGIAFLAALGALGGMILGALHLVNKQ